MTLDLGLILHTPLTQTHGNNMLYLSGARPPPPPTRSLRSFRTIYPLRLSHGVSPRPLRFQLDKFGFFGRGQISFTCDDYISQIRAMCSTYCVLI